MKRSGYKLNEADFGFCGRDVHEIVDGNCDWNIVPWVWNGDLQLAFAPLRPRGGTWRKVASQDIERHRLIFGIRRWRGMCFN